MPTLDLPRRERHRLQTWQAIHEAASALTLQDGLAGATIDAIASRADVSRRTFFNYFPTKEDAVLGTRSPELTAEDLAAFESSTEDAFGRIIRLMAQVLRSAVHDPGAFELRRELVRRYPELRTRLDQHVRESEGLVQAVLADGIPGLPDGLGGQQAPRVLVMLAGTVMRFAYIPRADGSIADGPEAIEAAITQFREVLKQLL